jgi:hypothetical protein
MEVVGHGLIAVAAVLAGLLVADQIEEPVKRTLRRWWHSRSG